MIALRPGAPLLPANCPSCFARSSSCLQLKFSSFNIKLSSVSLIQSSREVLNHHAIAGNDSVLPEWELQAALSSSDISEQAEKNPSQAGYEGRSDTPP